MSYSGMMRMSLYVSGRLAEQSWVGDGTQAAAASRRHLRLVAVAEECGKLWAAEIHDPDQPEEHSTVRFGTDARLVGPTSQEMGDLDSVRRLIAEHWGGYNRGPASTR